MRGIAILATVQALTLVIPRSKPNHRLTFRGGPRIINSAVNEDTRHMDYFNFKEQLTNLSNSTHSLCSYGNGIIECRSRSSDTPWRVVDEYREVRFKTALGDCLTVGACDGDRECKLQVEPCDAQNGDQVFILHQDHGLGRVPEINQRNVAYLSPEQKQEIATARKPFKLDKI